MSVDNQLTELAMLVKKMRTLQKQFFSQSKTASQYERARLVADSKALEKQVDEAVEKVLHPKPEQAQLF